MEWPVSKKKKKKKKKSILVYFFVSLFVFLLFGNYVITNGFHLFQLRYHTKWQRLFYEQ